VGEGRARPALLEVGRVARAHGIRGEVVVELWGEPDRVAPGSVLVTERGTVQVETSRRHRGRHLVRFAGVTDRSGAEALQGLVLRAEPLVRPGTLWAHELIGAAVVTTDGRRLGVVEALEENPASDLLVLSGGALVPLRFVVRFEPGASVVVEVPAGLVG